MGVPGLTYGSALLQKTVERSFWNMFNAYADPFEGLVFERTSTQKTDTYARLGAAPFPELWVGDKKKRDVNEYSTTLQNRWYESTVPVDKDLVLFDQIDEVATLASNLGMKAQALRISLHSTDLNNGAAATGDDGQFFFDTDHADPGAIYTTSQDNDLTADVTSHTAITDLEMATAIRAMVDALYGFKDDRGDPFAVPSDGPADFVVMVPCNQSRSIAERVLRADTLTGPLGNDLRGTFTVRKNPFLTSLTATPGVPIFLLYAGSAHKPMIRQTAQEVRLTDYEDPDTGAVVYSATWCGRTGYGQWRTAIRYEFT
jgi:phage major head subunit gpT-like protein